MRSTYRFGKIEAENGELPDLEDIKDTNSAREFDGELGSRRGTRNIFIQGDYLHLTYVQEYPDEYTKLGDNYQDVNDVRYPRKTMSIILFSDGRLIYESKKKITIGQALRHIFDEWNLELDMNHINEFSLETMRAFYHDVEMVRKMKLKNIGGEEPNPTWPEQWEEDVVTQAGEIVNSLETSVGHAYRDIREAEILDRGFQRLSRLKKVAGLDEDDNSIIVKQSARLTMSLPSDMDEREKIESVMNTVSGFLDEVDFEDVE